MLNTEKGFLASSIRDLRMSIYSSIKIHLPIIYPCYPQEFLFHLSRKNGDEMSSGIALMIAQTACK